MEPNEEAQATNSMMVRTSDGEYMVITNANFVSVNDKCLTLCNRTETKRVLQRSILGGLVTWEKTVTDVDLKIVAVFSEWSYCAVDGRLGLLGAYSAQPASDKVTLPTPAKKTKK